MAASVQLTELSRGGVLKRTFRILNPNRLCWYHTVTTAPNLCNGMDGSFAFSSSLYPFVMLPQAELVQFRSAFELLPPSLQ